MLREFLVYLKQHYEVNRDRFSIFVGIGLLVCFIADFLVDKFLPFGSWWMVIRTILLIPTGLAIFSLGYFAALYMHNQQFESNDDWVPYRMRYSLKWRRNIAIICAAVLVVFIYATGFSPFYTIMSSIFAAIAIGLLAFIRPTQKEQMLDELDIPDTRDLQYAQFLEEREQEEKPKKTRRRSKVNNEQ